jgi:hypothetical protein
MRKLLSWLTGGTPVSRRAPVVRFRPVLFALDERAVPDGTVTDPPDGDPPPENPPPGPEQSYTFEVAPGEWLYAGYVEDQDILFTIDEDGRQWLYSVTSETGMWTAVLVNYDGSYDPSAHCAVQSNFSPDDTKWNYVWNPDLGAWSTAAPGTVFTDPVSGFTSGNWNFVLLQANGPARPVNPPTTGTVTVTVTVNGQTVTITMPNDGTSVTVTPDGNGGGRSRQLRPAGNRHVTRSRHLICHLLCSRPRTWVRRFHRIGCPLRSQSRLRNLDRRSRRSSRPRSSMTLSLRSSRIESSL